MNWTTILPTIDYNMERELRGAPSYLFCCALSLAAISVFLRAGFVLKFISMVLAVCMQGLVLWNSDLFINYNLSLFGLET